MSSGSSVELNQFVIAVGICATLVSFTVISVSFKIQSEMFEKIC